MLLRLQIRNRDANASQVCTTHSFSRASRSKRINLHCVCRSLCKNYKKRRQQNFLESHNSTINSRYCFWELRYYASSTYWIGKSRNQNIARKDLCTRQSIKCVLANISCLITFILIFAISNITGLNKPDTIIRLIF